MSFRVEFTERAADQVHAAAEWWRTNRSVAPDLFEQEFTYAIEMLGLDPPRAQVFAEIESKVVRKVRLPRTRYALYFTIDDECVTVHALWHASRGEDPPL